MNKKLTLSLVTLLAVGVACSPTASSVSSPTGIPTASSGTPTSPAPLPSSSFPASPTGTPTTTPTPATPTGKLIFCLGAKKTTGGPKNGSYVYVDIVKKETGEQFWKADSFSLLVPGAYSINELEFPEGDYTMRIWKGEDAEKLFESNKVKPTETLPITGGPGTLTLSLGAGCNEALQRYKDYDNKEATTLRIQRLYDWIEYYKTTTGGFALNPASGSVTGPGRVLSADGNRSIEVIPDYTVSWEASGSYCIEGKTGEGEQFHLSDTTNNEVIPGGCPQ